MGYSLAEVDPPTAPECGDDEPSREETMELIYRLHSKALFRFMLRLNLGDHREAEDLLQETLLRAWRYVKDHAADPHALRPWLFTVARRLSIDASRARNSRPTEVIVEDLNMLSDTRDDVEQLLIALTIHRGLTALTANHRRVILEVYYYGRSPSEAAVLIGIPEPTAKSRLFYALKALQRNHTGCAVPRSKKPAARSALTGPPVQPSRR
jgi:RNA polymerase sigma-70 factor (ECF subfamily)